MYVGTHLKDFTKLGILYSDPYGLIVDSTKRLTVLKIQCQIMIMNSYRFTSETLR